MLCTMLNGSLCRRRKNALIDQCSVAAGKNLTLEGGISRGQWTNGEFYYSVDLSKDVKYKAEAAV